MSETKENLCPECGHSRNLHRVDDSTPPFCYGCAALTTNCTRTYESLVGEKGKTCPCQNWQLVSGHGIMTNRITHHPHCDGYGNNVAPPESAKYEQVAEKETASAIYARRHGLCEHCGSRGHKTGDAVCNRFDKQDAEPEPSLSLLVMDLGDSCVVKEERGQLPNLPESIGVITHGDSHTGDTFLVSTDFPELRSAIDGEKPVPRIERVLCGPNTVGAGETIYEVYGSGSAGREVLGSPTYNALSELAGKPLPIYEGGKWERLDGKFNPMDAYGELPVKVWRYSR